METHVPVPVRPRHRVRTAVVVVAFGSLLAAGCSGSSDGDASGGAGAELAACPIDALPADGDEPADITVWHPYSGLTMQAFEGIVDDYNASQSSVRVAAEGQGTSAELHKKFQETIGDDASMPEAIFSEDVNLQFLADSDTVVPATSCIEADPDAGGFYEQVFQPVRSAYSLDDVLLPSAFGLATMMVYANDAHLRAAGIGTGEMPETLDELRSMAEQVRDADIDGVAEPVVLKMDPWVLETLLTGADHLMVNEQNGRAGLATESELDDDAARGVMQWISSMIEDGLLKPVPYGESIDDFLAIAGGTSTFTISGSGSITPVAEVMGGGDPGGESGDDAAKEALARIDLRAGLVPGITEAGRSNVAGTAGYVLQASDAQIAATWDFMKYFNELPQQVRWSLEGSYLPLTTAALESPEIRAAADTTLSGKWLALVATGISNLDANFPGPSIGPYAEYRNDVLRMMDGIASGDDVEPSLTAASEGITEALQAYRDEVEG